MQPPIPTASDVAEMESGELAAMLEAQDIEPYHARQIYRWVYRRGIVDFHQMTDLSQPLRSRLAGSLLVSSPRVADRAVSSDGTVKFLLELADGRRIESVFIPDTPAAMPDRGRPSAGQPDRVRRERATLCISTQAGCAMTCRFCLTGRMGLARNLTAGEIAGQVRVLAGELGLRDKPFNIVLMGMGEPLHNYDATMKALRMLADGDGLAVSPRRMTLSTIGVVPALDRLAAEPLMPNLAVSLHATTEEQRDQIVPVNRAHGLADILDACRRFPLKRRNRITFEYVLLAGVNDTADDARRLARLLAGMRCKVNLIPLNEAPAIPFTRPQDADIDRFAAALAARHLTVSVRRSRGRDIRAACGQLIVEGSQKSPAQRLATQL
jgi:23S rRNA (adenine2503-C2)-methyltransferase